MPISPIVLFTYNRPDHTRQTLAALAANELANESNLFIYSDAPRSEQAEKGVGEVRNLIRNTTGFRSVTIIERSENYGLSRSIISGVSELVAKFGRVIVLEDDLVTSPHFLRYMNDALNCYADEEQVISIHAYVYPVKERLSNTFFLRGADCWGWATWKRGWDLFEPDGVKLLQELKAKKLVHEFDFNGTYPYTQMLEKQVLGENDSWAIRWYASAFLQNRLTLYPGRSLVQNIGNDASGTHCGVSGRFDSGLSPLPVEVDIIPVQESLQARDSFCQYFKSGKVPFMQKLLNSVRKRIPRLASSKPGYHGDFTSWAEAVKSADGYDSDGILEKVRHALSMVRDGHAVYERDSVLFSKVEYSWPLLTSLLWIASQQGNCLRLIDFGGSLGSSYFQNRAFLRHLNVLSWNIVEQESFVSCGQTEFANENLHFYRTISDCQKECTCDVILLASVLPYIENPYALLNEIIAQGFSYILIDRTPVLSGTKDRLTVQVVPPEIYTASYPAWFLSEQKMLDMLSPHYETISDFDSLIPRIKLTGDVAREKGYIFRKRP